MVSRSVGLAVIGLAILLLTLGAVQGSSNEKRGVVPLEGVIEVGVGITPVSDDGVTSSVNPTRQLPEGRIAVPADVQRVQIAVEVVPNTSTESVFYLEACDGDCEEGSGPIARAEGGRFLSVDVPVSGATNLGWLVLPQEGQQVNAEVSGQAELFGPPPGSGAGEPGARSQTTDGPSIPGALSLPGWIPVHVAVGLLLTAGARLARVGAGHDSLPLPWPGVSDRPGEDLLDHPARSAIHEVVTDEPGVHFSELLRRVDIGRGTLEYHLQKLEEAGLVRFVRFEGFQCVFPSRRFDPDLEEAMNVVRSENARTILAALVEGDSLTLREIEDRFGIPASTAWYHLGRLEDEDLVRKVEDGDEPAIKSTDLGERVSSLLGLNE